MSRMNARTQFWSLTQFYSSEPFPLSFPNIIGISQKIEISRIFLGFQGAFWGISEWAPLWNPFFLHEISIFAWNPKKKREIPILGKNTCLTILTIKDHHHRKCIFTCREHKGSLGHSSKMSLLRAKPFKMRDKTRAKISWFWIWSAWSEVKLKPC